MVWRYMTLLPGEAPMVEPFNPLDHGLWSRVLAGLEVDEAGWNRMRAERGYIGACRACGGYLVPGSVEDHSGIRWFEASCLQCGKVIAAPGGRVLRRSSRHHEMPPDWWERRCAALAAEHAERVKGER